MEKREDIRNEMLQVSETVAAIGNTNTYAVPPGYFTNLADDILQAVKQEAVLPFVQTPLPQPPAGYFEGLADSILAKIKTGQAPAFENETSEELHAVAPLLTTISRQNVYTVPDGYFDNLKITVTADAAPAKVVAMPSATRRWFGYAAAAVVAGVAVVGALLFTQQNTVTPARPVNLSQSISSLKDAEIVRFLNSEPNVDIVGTSTESIPLKSTDMKTLLNTVSDEEIQQYLRTAGNESDIKPIKGI